MAFRWVSFDCGIEFKVVDDDGEVLCNKEQNRYGMKNEAIELSVIATGQRGGVFGQQKIPKLRQMAQNLHRSCQLTKYTYRSLICSHIAYSIQIMRTYLRKRGYNYEDGCGGDAMDASTAKKRPTAISNGLGLNKQMQPTKTRDFYGRWRMRISRRGSQVSKMTATAADVGVGVRINFRRELDLKKKVMLTYFTCYRGKIYEM
ncbi:hypothetical protein Tco_0092337 [Tanacetum coccineum]